jgi:hypothetical protein
MSNKTITRDDLDAIRRALSAHSNETRETARDCPSVNRAALWTEMSHNAARLHNVLKGATSITIEDE